MKFTGTVLSVKDINKARKFYEDLFGLELFQDYGILFTAAFPCSRISADL